MQEERLASKPEAMQLHHRLYFYLQCVYAAGEKTRCFWTRRSCVNKSHGLEVTKIICA